VKSKRSNPPSSARSRSAPPHKRGGEQRPAKNPAPKPKQQLEIQEYICEADVAEGLEKIAWREIRVRFGERVEQIGGSAKPGTLRFSYIGNLYQLLRLQTVQAVYLVRHYPIPRPKAFLGDQHLKALLAQIATVRELAPKDAYHTLYISAAGSESSVMTRLRDELAAKTGLTASNEEGDLLIRLRHPPGDEASWEALVRISPRPLATRPWRVCNREGALNATVAHAMAFLTQPKPEDIYLNLACGSGTLLIERLAQEEAASVMGYDLDETALECARRNVEAAGLTDRVSLRVGDIRSLPLPDKSVDAICADLPFGHLVGSHEDNLTLYPEVLGEAARVIKTGGRCVFISHEVRLMDSLLDGSKVWDTEQVIRVALGGLYPRIYVLVRR
jgi:tRNA (guanine6-N2)-methyltransferase